MKNVVRSEVGLRLGDEMSQLIGLGELSGVTVSPALPAEAEEALKLCARGAAGP